ncbi:septation protein SepH [Protofrankia symbiont of Coriaria ruscifolia]|uniref:septation protein SepH n=1 Tax=Protofrankia symbiont of Coriaria ruscifolia TaxID=1306542 RepID=UPI00104142DF|nr:septation protein SepH [Protofrankia symbiont of Coriaria ruscifolia]
MRELRAVALSEDGGYLVLADTAGGPDAEKFRVPVDDRLRATLRGARRNEVRQESALTPREIQARLRAGETTAEVARVAGIPVERVERYEGPVLAERARVVQEARAALLPKDPGGAPGRPLGEVVDARLLAVQDDPESAQWDAWRRVDGIWLVQLTSESRCARWTWDPVVRRVRPHDDAARALVAPEAPIEPTASQPPPQPVFARPAGPALTLVQEPATVHEMQVPSDATSAPLSASLPTVAAAPPPTPIQPAAARGRTHGLPRPAARSEAPVIRPPAPAAPLTRTAEPQNPVPVAPVASVTVEVVGARDARPIQDVPVIGVDTPAPTVSGSIAPEPVPAGPAPAGAERPAAPAPRASAVSGSHPQATAAPEPATGVDDGIDAADITDITDAADAADTAARASTAPRGRAGAAGRTPERGSGGRKNRKPVPAWDDIVFGARRP